MGEIFSLLETPPFPLREGVLRCLSPVKRLQQISCLISLSHLTVIEFVFKKRRHPAWVLSESLREREKEPCPRVMEREQGGEPIPRLKEWGEGERQKGGDTEMVGGGTREGQCLNSGILFSTYLIWHKPLRGLFSYGLGCYSIWFWCIHPHELFVLMCVVSDSSFPSSSPSSQGQDQMGKLEVMRDGE